MKKKRLISLLLALSVVLSSISAMGVVATAATTDVLRFGTWEPEDGEPYAYLVSCDPEAVGNIRVPATYEGYPVKYITEGAFADCVNVSSIVFEGNVEQVQPKAFQNCLGLTSVDFPDTIQWIGNNVFSGCENIKNIFFADIDSLFNAKLDMMWAPSHYWNLYVGNRHMTDMVVPEGVTYIDWGAFDCCNSLKSVTLPTTIEDVETFAFYDCPYLETIIIPDVAVDINERAFAQTKFYKNQNNWSNGILYAGNHVLSAVKATGKVTLKDGTVSVGTGAFSGATVTEVIFPDSVKAINNCLAANSSIESVTIGSGVEIIPFGSFANCEKLSSVTFSEGLKRIEKRAFASCVALTSAELPETLEYLDSGAFYNCTALANLQLPASLGEYDLSNFKNTPYINLTFSESNPYYSSEDGIVYNKDKTAILYVPTSANGIFTIPDTVKSIGENAFKDCVNITGIVFGSGLETIGENVFAGCTGLKTLTVNNNVNTIGANAFSGCTGIETLVIENNVEAIGDYAFKGCVGLKDVTIGDGVATLGNYAFEGCTGITKLTLGKGITTIPDYAFVGCSGLTTVVIPENVKEIGEGAFKDCAELVSVVFTKGLTTIGDCAFENCQSLLAITIPTNVKNIGNYAFRDCVNLEYVTLHSGIDFMGLNVFKNTKYYNDIVAGTVDGNIYEGDTLVLATGTHVVIKEGITRIAKGAINSDEIVSITLPNSLTYVEKGFNAPNLEEVRMQNLEKWLNLEYEDETANILGMCPNAKACIAGIFIESTLIPPGVTKIQSYKYANNPFFLLAIIPNSVTEIEDNAFYGCSSKFTIKCGENSAAHKYAIENGFRYVLFDKYDPYNTVVDMDESILETENEMVDTPDEIVASNLGTIISFISSHKHDNIEIFGTGSKIVVVVNGVRYEFTLVVKGDINGDGICDALDIEAIHRVLQGKGGYNKYVIRAMDTNSDEEINVSDYQGMVNKALYK